GATKSGDSIMLSCLSPRSPCWGPNAAVRRSPLVAASASTEWVRSAVTDAGCASNPSRLPASGRRSAASASSRSIPNLIPTPDLASALRSLHPQRERLGVMEVGRASGMSERPVGSAAAPGFDDRGDREPEPRAPVRGRQRIERDDRIELETVCGAAHGDRWRERGVVEPTAVSVSGERVRGPGARGGEVELVIGRAHLAGDEALEAGVLPQALALVRRLRLRNDDARHVPFGAIVEAELAVGASLDPRGDGPHRIARCSGVAAEGEISHTPIMPDAQ